MKILLLSVLLCYLTIQCPISLIAQTEKSQTPAGLINKSSTDAKTVEKKSDLQTTSAASSTANQQVLSDVSFERQSYRIEVRFTAGEQIALDSNLARQTLSDFVALADRVVGQPWNLTVRWADGEVWDTAFDQWTQWPEPIQYDRKTRPALDKIWLIQARPGAESSNLELVARDFDLQSGILGPTIRHQTYVDDLPRGLLMISRKIFRPVAELSGYEGGQVRLRVQASDLKAASAEGSIVTNGQYFQLVRMFFERNGKFVASTIEPWTYLKASVDPASGTTAQLISSFRDPLGRKYRQNNKLVAMALNPSENPTTLQFSQLVNTNGTPIRHPVAGYKVEIHRWPDGEVQGSYLTDRDGKLAIQAPPGLDFFGVRLVGGSLEPLLDVPVLSGDQVPAILADTKPAAVEFQQQLIAFRDDVLDAIARRLVIEARLADRTKAEDWDRVTTLIRDWKATPIPTKFSSTVAEWKESAQRRQIEEKKAIFTQASQALVAELEALVSRYETQDIEIFEESLQKKSKTPYLQDLAEQAKEKSEQKTAEPKNK